MSALVSTLIAGMSQTFPLLVSCAFGLESVVKRELATLGYEARGIAPGRLRISAADFETVARCNLWLRTADRVLVELLRFEALDFDALFETTRDLHWEDWIPLDGEIHVVGRSVNSQLSSVPACQRAVKKAIVDRLQLAHHGKPLTESGHKFKVEIGILKDEATVTLDTTGASLHKRGYRSAGAPAPLKETLAAALIQLSVWREGRPLLDPFCGSGTIVIEAARLARQIAPGIDRSFSFEDWHVCDPKFINQAREEANDSILPNLSERLIGADVDFRVLRHARASAEQGRVIDDVHFDERSFERTSSKRKYGCVITNPPYGERLGESPEIAELYRTMPEVFRKLSTWSFFILTNELGFESIVQRRAERRRKLYNGRIECTYFQFLGPKPTSMQRAEHVPIEADDVKQFGSDQSDHAITIDDALPDESQAASRESVRRPSRPPKEVVPVFGGLSPKSHEQAELFARRLTKRARHLRRWPTKQGITCFRLYEKDIPEVPLVVDRYEDHLHLIEYDRPHERDLGEHADWLDLMAKTAGETLGVPSQKVFLKKKQRQRGTLQHEKQAEAGYETIVNEGGLKFFVNLTDYVDTGLFLDHRITRSLVRDDVRGKDFLNLFAYTGAFTVYAADAPAKSTTTVDWSSAYVTWAERNLKLNRLGGDHHHFIRKDAREYVRNLSPQPQFDVVVLDPPTFSNSKRTDEVWDVQQDHAELINEILVRMREGGVLYFSNNFRRFKLDEESIQSDRIFEISKQTVPEDFRNRRIHRCWRIYKTT